LAASFADQIMLAWGWRRRLIALAAGAVGALAMAPLDIWPALAISLPIGVWLIDGSAVDAKHPRLAALRSAAGVGFWFGFGYHLAGLWWLGAAFLVNGDEFAWALPLGILVFPAGLALFFALAFTIAHLFWSDGPRRILTFAFALSGSEWLRGHVLTGFPWNLPGMALGSNLVLAQAASLIGAYGLTFLAVVIFASPATLATEPTLRARWTAPIFALVLLVGLAAFGAWRLAAGPPGMVPGARLRIMQPNLAPDQKFIPANREEIVSRYLALSDKATSPERNGIADITHLFWPESAFPFILTREPEMLARIAQALGDKTTLITGAIRAQEPLPGELNARFFNSIYVIGKDGTILSSDDKVHLVPFGEYLPLQEWLDQIHLRQFVRVPGGFTPGVERRTLEIPGLPGAAPLICYEAIFPAEVLPRDGHAVGFLVNVTNDAWFGLTSGPYQHLAQARLRTIEEGLPLVRAANSGISAVIDPFGRVVASLPLGLQGVLDAELPRAIAPPLYARLGDVPFWALMLASVVATFRLHRRQALARR
jgi:apolipoprotein N-acyltransferase